MISSQLLRDRVEAKLTPSFLTNKNIPSTLFHYTDAPGFLGMLNSRELWATDMTYLNDPSELGFAYRTFLEEFEQLISSDDERSLLGGLNFKLQQETNRPRLFSVSFCSNDDLLSQWRAYAGTGRGYAIGFKIEGAALNEGVFGKVNYGSEGIKLIATIVMEFFREFYDGSDNCRMTLLMSTVEYIHSIAPFYKHKLYEEENEVRLVTSRLYGLEEGQGEEGVKFRVSAGKIVPYLPINFEEVSSKARILPISEVRLGPAVDWVANRDAMRLLMRTYGLSAIVRPSFIPFRGEGVSPGYG